MYTHITQDKRTALAALLRAGYSQRSTAKELGINQSSISRELARNTEKEVAYHAAHAEKLARERRKTAKVAARKIENDVGLARFIESRLHPLVSPEVIAHDTTVSHETIYAWVYRSRPDLKALLPQRGKKRRRYGSKREVRQGWTKDVRSIHDRPEEADQRLEVGHFEGDGVRGRRGALLTLTDRKSRYEFAVKIPGERCDPIHAEIVKRRAKLGGKSFTFDRG